MTASELTREPWSVDNALPVPLTVEWTLRVTAAGMWRRAEREGWTIEKEMSRAEGRPNVRPTIAIAEKAAKRWERLHPDWHVIQASFRTLWEHGFSTMTPTAVHVVMEVEPVDTHVSFGAI